MTPYRPRALAAPRSSFFLFGPRGTGKTTWVRHEYPDAYRVDLLDEALYQGYLADAGRFAGEMHAVAPGSWVFVDEIQRLPGLLNEVHRFIEGQRSPLHPDRVIGSQAEAVRRQPPRRARGPHPHVSVPARTSWAPISISTRCSGTAVLPVVWNADDRPAALRAYVQLYLKEEIKGEALVRNLAGLRALFCRSPACSTARP